MASKLGLRNILGITNNLVVIFNKFYILRKFRNIIENLMEFFQKRRNIRVMVLILRGIKVNYKHRYHEIDALSSIGTGLIYGVKECPQNLNPAV